MVILGGLELVAAGYLINKHHKNKQEARRIKEEEEALEESRYRIYSADNAGPGRRRTHSQDRHDRKHSHSHRRHSHDRKHSRDDRRDDRKHSYDRPQKESRPHASSAPPPVYAAAVPVIHKAVRPPQPAIAPARPPVTDPSFPPTGWPQHWEQTQRPVTPQPQVAPMPPNLAPYYRDPAQADVKYGFRDDEGDRGRVQLRPEDANRGQGGRSRRGSSSRSVRFDVPKGRAPGDEAPPAYRP
jgi:hypothetical protein